MLSSGQRHTVMEQVGAFSSYTQHGNNVRWARSRASVARVLTIRIVLVLKFHSTLPTAVPAGLQPNWKNKTTKLIGRMKPEVSSLRLHSLFRYHHHVGHAQFLKDGNWGSAGCYYKIRELRFESVAPTWKRSTWKQHLKHKSVPKDLCADIHM